MSINFHCFFRVRRDVFQICVNQIQLSRDGRRCPSKQKLKYAEDVFGGEEDPHDVKRLIRDRRNSQAFDVGDTHAQTEEFRR